MVLPGPYVRQTLPIDQQDSVRGEIIAISDISIGTQEKTVPPRTASFDRLAMASSRKIHKAVIPAAGFGTRMLPATKAVPKEMLPVAGKPLIQYAVEEAAASGIKTVIVVVRQHKSIIQTHFAPDHALESFLGQRGLKESASLVHSLPEIAKLKFVEQRKPLGLAHAVSCARRLLSNEPFVVLLPDVIMESREPVVRQLIGTH